MTNETSIQTLVDHLEVALRKPSYRQMITSRTDWMFLAQAELDRRASALLAAFLDDELRLIASGKANLNDIADKIA